MLTSIPHGMAPWKVNATKCMVTVFTGVAVPKLSEYVETVSYTHLDVYKRQTHATGLERTVRSEPAALAFVRVAEVGALDAA